MKKPYRMKRLSKTRAKKAQKAAKHLSGVYAHAAFSYADNNPSRKIKGAFGAASECRSISGDELESLRHLYEGGAATR